MKKVNKKSFTEISFLNFLTTTFNNNLAFSFNFHVR
jgi:hypothetical protein